MDKWTIQKLLSRITEDFESKGIESARLSAELLLSCVLGMKRIELYTQFDREVAKEQLDRLRDLVKRAEGGEPIAHLTGRAEFYSLELEISPDCLIPRPETELLVERAIEFLRGRGGKQLVCELCTGCGCIAAAIAKNFSDANIIATDISDGALKIAAKNIEKHKLKERITLLCGDLFDPIIPELSGGKFDLIVCNPPYVSGAEFGSIDKGVRDYEPRPALLGGADGLDVYRKICEKVDGFLKPDGALIMEIGYRQGQAVWELLERSGCFGEITIEKDFQDNDRVITAIKTKNNQ